MPNWRRPHNGRTRLNEILTTDQPYGMADFRTAQNNEDAGLADSNTNTLTQDGKVEVGLCSIWWQGDWLTNSVKTKMASVQL